MAHLLFITPGFADGEEDTTCIPPLQAFVRALVQDGHLVSVVALEYPFRKDAFQFFGATIYPCNGKNNRWLRWRSMVRASRTIHDLHEKAPIAVLHSFWLGSASIIGDIVGRKLGIPHTCTLMGQDVRLEIKGRDLRKITSTQASTTITLSDFHASVFEQNTGLKPGAIIPWGLADADIPPQKTPLQERSINIVGVGSLIPLKNWGLWLESLAELKTYRPELRAVLVGGGPEFAKLKQKMHDLGLTNHVEMTGQLPRTAVLAIMQDSKVLLHTSEFESLGYIIPEASAQGCLVVGTPVGVAPAYGPTSWDKKELAKALLQALANPKTHSSKKIIRMNDTVEAYYNFWHDIGIHLNRV